jgi:uncharacterized membrane protein
VNQSAFAPWLRMAAYVLVIAYPFAVYLLLDRAGAGVLGAALIVILFIRNPSVLSAQRWLVLPALLILLAFLGFGPIESETLLRLYPVGISAVLFCTFGATVLWPPTIAERMASASGVAMTAAIRRYTRNVTLIWCLFFICNGLAALYIGLTGSMDVWVLYNGVLSYILMGCLFAGDYLVRLRYLKKHQVREEHLDEGL